MNRRSAAACAASVLMCLFAVSTSVSKYSLFVPHFRSSAVESVRVECGVSTCEVYRHPAATSEEKDASSLCDQHGGASWRHTQEAVQWCAGISWRPFREQFPRSSQNSFKH
ncbi:hypothetical protein DIPPA_28819 [Diplonema papillatum]|nr:hypothetical protein DIPPA_28819 [Diplonema papillatum]